ncbi:uncharacterized protein LOC117643538 isoform X2 [Thrips palmi]|uniref:Uncharacterized protein LOC117643538 isoform X2 n=1 Tax=Thrips palmi TaxID=161013 RepID=A0A6P8YMI4_THRPL|nr:uncharacterized protein LOC117643538 isoform X2 [Thrips palmi]
MWSDTGHNIKKCDSKSSYPSNATLESVLLPFIVLWTIVLLMAFDQVRTKTINSFAVGIVSVHSCITFWICSEPGARTLQLAINSTPAHRTEP